nr:RHS repeat-associated core domain-containing protein [Muribacter muris]
MCFNWYQFKYPNPIDPEMLFAGQWLDQESGLAYNRFRYYDPETGNYLCLDPIGLAGGEKTYSYVSNPFEQIDELGLSTRRKNFRAAKQAAGIPKSSQFDTHKFVHDNTSENRTVFKFSNEGKNKYVILHENDKFGRGPHFHAADDSKGSPMDKGRYKQYNGHFPEDIQGFEKVKKCKK